VITLVDITDTKQVEHSLRDRGKSH